MDWSERLKDVLTRNGCRARIVKVERLRALQDEIVQLRKEGAFGVEFLRAGARLAGNTTPAGCPGPGPSSSSPYRSPRSG